MYDIRDFQHDLYRKRQTYKKMFEIEQKACCELHGNEASRIFSRQDFKIIRLFY